MTTFKKRNLQVGDKYTAIAINGHKMVYTVVGFDREGYPNVNSWEATCADDCGMCRGGESRPDW